jgi:DNA-binding response OmpR family regulator
MNKPERKLILVIDDDTDMLRLMKVSLDQAGYDCFIAADGLMGLDVLKNIHPDVIVCDVLMPNMNGFDFCRTIRKMPEWASIPFIFLTADDSKGRQKEARLAGADDFLLKPFDMDELLLMVKTRLSRLEQIVSVQKTQEPGGPPK